MIAANNSLLAPLDTPSLCIFCTVSLSSLFILDLVNVFSQKKSAKRFINSLLSPIGERLFAHRAVRISPIFIALTFLPSSVFIHDTLDQFFFPWQSNEHNLFDFAHAQVLQAFSHLQTIFVIN